MSYNPWMPDGQNPADTVRDRYPHNEHFSPFFLAGSDRPTGTAFQARVGFSTLDCPPLVKRLDVWKSVDQFDSRIRGIELHYEGGVRTGVFGQTGNSALNSYHFAPGERITQLTLWSSVGFDHGRVGRIKFTTSTGHTFDWGLSDDESKGLPAHSPHNIGNGFFVGLTGRAGSDLDQICFMFFAELTSIKIDDVKYLALPDGKAGVQPVMFAEGHYEADDQSTNWTFNGVRKQSVTTSFSQSSIVEVGVSVSVSASLFEIVDTEAGAEWKQTDAKEVSTSTTVELETDYGLSGTLLPGSRVDIQGVYYSGVANVQYTSKVTWFFKRGVPSSWTEEGTLKQVAYSNAILKQVHSSQGLQQAKVEDHIFNWKKSA